MKVKLTIVALAVCSALGGAACSADDEPCARGKPEPVLEGSRFEPKGTSSSLQTVSVVPRYL